MALGITPTLTQINTELGLSGQSLTACILAARKTGVWTKQSDFAGYSAAYLNRRPIAISADYLGGIYFITITSNVSWIASRPSSDTWLRITSSAFGSSNGKISVRINQSGLITSRSSTITIEGGGIKKTVAVWQAANDGGTCGLCRT